jgi:lysozyme family protein
MSNDITNIIDDLLRREGGLTNDPNDAGGRTNYGISEKSNPSAWADNKVTEAEAREIYLTKYVKGPKFDQIPDTLLRAQLVDFGVNSGPSIAIQKLQHIVGVEADGIIGPKTLTALASCDVRAVNNKLAAERIKMIGRICAKNPNQLKFLGGWLNRALEFLV